MPKPYTPPTETLEKYAELIVQFGLQRPDGSKLPKGSVVLFKVPEAAKPLFFYLQRAILKQGHFPFPEYEVSSDGTYAFEADFYQYASEKQRQHFHIPYHKALMDMIDARILIVAETNIHELDAIDGKKVMQKHAALKPLKDLQLKKIDAGKLSWTIALYGTPDMAKAASMSEKAYWKQIIEACYLDEADPVKTWRQISRTTSKTAVKLTSLKITKLHWQGSDMDITVGVGANRAWRAGGGNNIPSYEVFTSPHMHKADGWIRFNQPHFRYGKRIEGIELWFKNGQVVKSAATKNHDLLKQMLKTPGGNRLGEVSLTDARISRITKPTGEILYDENMGGKYGNTHMAIGSSFHDCFTGDGSRFSAAQWHKLGFNDSVVHSDFVSTTDRTVTATLESGEERVIYKDGMFVV